MALCQVYLIIIRSTTDFWWAQCRSNYLFSFCNFISATHRHSGGPRERQFWSLGGACKLSARVWSRSDKSLLRNSNELCYFSVGDALCRGLISFKLKSAAEFGCLSANWLLSCKKIENDGKPTEACARARSLANAPYQRKRTRCDGLTISIC